MRLRVATFNAGLAVGLLPHTRERLLPIIQAIAELDVDLLFVQEFWLDSDFAALKSALASKLPHSFRPPPVLQGAEGRCTAEQLQPLRACAEARCAGLSDEALARCVVSHCAQTAWTLPGECLNCIASNPIGTLDEILGRCLADRQLEMESVPRPGVSSGGLIAYGGSFGTGLLAKYPLEERALLTYLSSINARGALYASVRLEQGSPLHLFATHFSPGGAEQPPQVDDLLTWVESKAPDGLALLLGDLNTTPGSALFRRLTSAGFREGDAPDRRGTFTNAGLETGETATSFRIDHVLVRNHTGSLRTERVLDEPRVLYVAGRPVRTTLSDHFGVLATIHL